MFAPLCGGIGPTEEAMAGRLLCVHLESGDSYVLYDRFAHLFLFRPPRDWTSVSIHSLRPQSVPSVDGLCVIQAFVGFSCGGIHHVSHQGFVVFTQAVRTPGHQAEYVIFSR